MLERNPYKRTNLQDLLTKPIFSRVEKSLGSKLENGDKLVTCLRAYKESNHLTKAFRIKMTKL